MTQEGYISEIIGCLTDQNRGKVQRFLLRYVFQVSLFAIWSERNRRRHGEDSRTPLSLIKLIDKQVRNQLSSMQQLGALSCVKAMETWFSY